MSPKIQPLGLSVSDTAALFTKNRNFVYRKVRLGELTLVKISQRSSLITTKSIIEFAQKIGLPLTF